MSGVGDSALNWYSARLAKALAHAGVQVKVVGPRQDNCTSSLWNDDGVIVYSCFRRGSVSAFAEALRPIIAAHNKVLHVQHELFAYGGLINALLLPLLLACLKLCGYKVLTTVHGVIPLSEVSSQFIKKNRFIGSPTIVRLLWQSLIRFVSSCSTCLHVHEPFLKDLLVSEYSVPWGKIEVIPLGVEPITEKLEKPVARRALGLGKEDEVVLFFGYLAAYKGIEYLLSELDTMLARRPNLNVIIAGDVPARLKRKINVGAMIQKVRVGQDRVHRLGFLTDAQIPTVFSASDVLLLPYEVAMSSSGPLALAVGFDLPAIFSSAFKQSFPDAPSFFELKPGALTEAVSNLFENQDVRDKTQAFIKDLKFRRSWPVVASSLLTLYDRLSSKTFSQTGPRESDLSSQPYL